MHASASAVVLADRPARIASFLDHFSRRTCDPLSAAFQLPPANVLPRRRISPALCESALRRRGICRRTSLVLNAGSDAFFFHAAEIRASTLLLNSSTSRKKVSYGDFHPFGRNSVSVDLLSQKLGEEK